MKRLFAYLVIAVLLISAVSTSVSAANYTDTEFSFFTINAEHFTLLEEKRAKDDDSSVYVFFYDYVNPRKAVKVATYGYTSTTTSGVNLTYKGGRYIDYVTCLKNVHHGIYNKIKEDGYFFASLGMQSVDGTDIVSGLWSPDSIGDLVIAQ